MFTDGTREHIKKERGGKEQDQERPRPVRFTLESRESGGTLRWTDERCLNKMKGPITIKLVHKSLMSVIGPKLLPRCAALFSVQTLSYVNGEILIYPSSSKSLCLNSVHTFM